VDECKALPLSRTLNPMLLPGFLRKGPNHRSVDFDSPRHWMSPDSITEGC
jgi:hypothetical protein